MAACALGAFCGLLHGDDVLRVRAEALGEGDVGVGRLAERHRGACALQELAGETRG